MRNTIAIPDDGYLPNRHGDTLDHLSNWVVAQAVVLSVWQEVHGFGILYLSVIAGVMN